MPVVNALRMAGAALALVCLALPAASQQGSHGGSGLTQLVEQWLVSPHGDYASVSFTYWNDEGEVPVNCAACHSQTGFIDFLGADGSTPGVVDHPAVTNAPIGCASCHTEAAHALQSVAFPSGVTVDGLGASAVCTVCHQGRQSGEAVLAATEAIDADTVAPGLSFINIHYGTAASIMRGADVRAGVQYPGRAYAGRFAHVPSASTCVACHDAHTTQVAVDGCLSCHRGVTEIRAIRTRHVDFDGDGDIAGGIHAEIIGLQARLLSAIQAYGTEIIGTPVGYAPGRFPYFFNDSNGDGRIDDSEAGFPNRYQSWTPRLLRAAYNYKVATSDPGGYTHNPTYLMQLLYDSLESLATQLDLPMGDLRRP